MLNNQSTNIEHIIAKLDNDFNIDHSDYIPRVAAWVIEALSILKCNITETKKIKIKVNDRIACFDGIDTKYMKVYDSNGCELESMEDITKNAGSCSKCDSSTGEDSQSNMIVRDEQIAIPIDSSKYPTEYVTTSRLKAIKGINNNRYYVLLSNNKLELNYDADCIFIKYKGVKTYYSDMYGCELPVIPNNGLLIEESENINIPSINISDCGEHGIRLGATRDGVYSQKDFNFGTVILKRCGRCGFKALTSEDKIIKNINIDELITIDVNYNGSAGDNKDSLRLEGVENVVVGRINAKKELNERSCSNIVYITNAKHVLIDSVVGNNTAKEGILVTDERGQVNDLFIKNINIRATDLELIKVNHKIETLRDIVFSNIYGREFKSEYGIDLLVGTVGQPIILDGYINKGSQTGIYYTDAGSTSLEKIANKLIEV